MIRKTQQAPARFWLKQFQFLRFINRLLFLPSIFHLSSSLSPSFVHPAHSSHRLVHHVLLTVHRPCDFVFPIVQFVLSILDPNRTLSTLSANQQSLRNILSSLEISHQTAGSHLFRPDLSSASSLIQRYVHAALLPSRYDHPCFPSPATSVI